MSQPSLPNVDVDASPSSEPPFADDLSVEPPPHTDHPDAFNKHSQTLPLDDFSLVFQGQTLVGLYGLWDQKDFKQTRVVSYHPLITLVRPLYNFWARYNQRLILPPKGDLLQYLILHSPLCRPDQVELFDYMVRSAFAQSMQRGISALCYSLVAQDPRRVVQARHHGNVIRGVHGFYSFGKNPAPHFDSQRLTYLECGRI